VAPRSREWSDSQREPHMRPDRAACELLVQVRADSILASGVPPRVIQIACRLDVSRSWGMENANSGRSSHRDSFSYLAHGGGRPGRFVGRRSGAFWMSWPARDPFCLPVTQALAQWSIGLLLHLSQDSSMSIWIAQVPPSSPVRRAEGLRAMVTADDLARSARSRCNTAKDDLRSSAYTSLIWQPAAGETFHHCGADLPWR
jgi:hypothetical protein